VDRTYCLGVLGASGVFACVNWTWWKVVVVRDFGVLLLALLVRLVLWTLGRWWMWFVARSMWWMRPVAVRMVVLALRLEHLLLAAVSDLWA
jgi:hypothetical protein